MDIINNAKVLLNESMPVFEVAFGVKMDYSPDSLKVLEKYIVQNHSEGDVPESIIILFGFYLGEVINRNLPNSHWVGLDSENLADLAVEAIGENKTNRAVVYPFRRIEKFSFDHTDSIWGFYFMTKDLANGKLTTMTDGKWHDSGKGYKLRARVATEEELKDLKAQNPNIFQESATSSNETSDPTSATNETAESQYKAYGYTEAERKAVAQTGFYVHAVQADNSPHEFDNMHTHWVPENFGHLDFQIVLNPVLAGGLQNEYFLIAELVDSVKHGTKYSAGEIVWDVFKQERPIEFINAVEGDRNVLRVIVSDTDGRLPRDPECHPLFKEQLNYTYKH